MTKPHDNQGEGHDPVTFCHKPGTPAQQELTTDDDGFLQGHLNHGDALGACLVITPPVIPEPYSVVGEWIVVTHASCDAPSNGLIRETVTHNFALDESGNVVETLVTTTDTSVYNLTPEEITSLCPVVVEPTPTPTVTPTPTPTTTPEPVVPVTLTTTTTESSAPELAQTGAEDVSITALILGAALLISGIITLMSKRRRTN